MLPPTSGHVPRRNPNTGACHADGAGTGRARRAQRPHALRAKNSRQRPHWPRSIVWATVVGGGLRGPTPVRDAHARGAPKFT